MAATQFYFLKSHSINSDLTAPVFDQRPLLLELNYFNFHDDDHCFSNYLWVSFANNSTANEYLKTCTYHPSDLQVAGILSIDLTWYHHCFLALDVELIRVRSNLCWSVRQVPLCLDQTSNQFEIIWMPSIRSFFFSLFFLFLLLIIWLVICL